MDLRGKRAVVHGDDFFGRVGELTLGHDAWLAALGGHRQVLLIAGEPGVGKTRLAMKVGEEAPPGSCLLGRASESGGSPALWPWIQVLRACLELPVVPTVRQRVGDAVSFVEAMAADQPAAPASPLDDASRFGAFDAIGRFLFEVIAEHPLLIILDDLHAADITSLELLQFVARSRTAARLLLVGTYRPVEIRDDERRMQLVSSIAREGRTCDLAGLGADHVVEMAHAFRPGLPERDARAVHSWTGGNPLFIKELMRTLPPGGVGDALPETALRSLTLDDVIRRRVGRLSEDVLAVVRLASVLGRTFDVTALRALLPYGETELGNHIQHSVEEGILVPGAISTEVAFAHELIRAAVYVALPDDERRAAHAAAAAHFAKQNMHDATGSAEVIAHHYANAGPQSHADAARYLQMSGEMAMGRYAYKEAEEQFRHALALGVSTPETSRDLMILMGAAQRRSGDVAADQTLCEAAELARAAGDGDRLAAALIHLVGQTAGNPYLRQNELIDAVEDALASCPPTRADLRARLLSCLVSKLSAPSDSPRRQAAAQEAYALAETIGDDWVKADVLLAACVSVYYEWRPDHRRDVEALLTLTRQLRRSSSGSARLRARELELTAHRVKTGLLLEEGDIAAFEQEAAIVSKAAKELNQPSYLFAAECLQAAKDQMAGRMDRLAKRAAHLLEVAPDHPASLIAYFVQSGWALYEMDRLGEMRDDLVDTLQAMPLLTGVRLFLAMDAIQSDRPEEARGFVSPIAADLAGLPRDAQWLSFVAALAPILRDLDEGDLARAVGKMLAPHAARHVVISFGQASCYLGSVHLYLGTAAMAAGDSERSIDHLQASLVEHDRVGAFAWSARSKYELALALHRAGRSTDALPLVEAAIAQVAPLPMEYLRRRATELRSHLTLGAGVLEVLRDGDGWVVRRGARHVRVRDLRGLEYLARLVRAAGQELSAADLIAGSSGSRPASPDGDLHESPSRMPLLDDEAKAAYKRHLADLEDDILEAEAHHDNERASRLRAERDRVIDELKRAAGLGGRTRTFADSTEKARVSVTKAIKRAIDEIEARDSSLGDELRRAVSTGIVCSYRP